jgi:putative membrane protein
MWRHFGFINNWWCGPEAFFPGPFGMIITILFWIFIAVLVVKLFQVFFNNKAADTSDILEVIKTRYAHGEINKEEFEQMKLALK